MTRQPDGVRGTTIVGTGMYVPERILTNADFERMVDTSDEWIRERTGIRERHMAAPDQAASDLAVIAARRALEAAGISVDEIDQIIVATTTPDRLVPSCACIVQAKLGAKSAAAFDVFAACSGFIFATSLARAAIGTSVADTVLVIGVEVLTRITDYTDRNTCVLFGDGAGAVVMRPCATGEGILADSIHSDGTLGDLIEMPAGGSAMPASHETVDRRLHALKMRGKELFKVAVRGMEESMRLALDRAGVSAAELDLVIPHQANQRIIDAVREKLGVSADKVVLNIDRYGNTSSASIPISLDEVVRAGRLKPGDMLGLVAFGGGVTWGASVARWTMATPRPAAVKVESLTSAREVVGP